MRFVGMVACLALAPLLTPVVARAQTVPVFDGTWGSTGSAPGQLNLPYGVVVSPDGSLYVSDQGNFRIVKYTTDGVLLTTWGSRGGAPGQFNGTIGMGVDPAGRLYVADFGNNRVQVFESGGAFVRQWAIDRPRDIAIARDGLVHVVSHHGPRIDVFSQEGVPVSNYADNGLGSPTSIVFDTFGDVYVADEGGFNGYGNNVSKWSASGALLARWGTTGEAPGQFNGAAGIAIDGFGNVLVVEVRTNRGQTFSPTGTFLAAWGAFGTLPGQFNGPADIAVDAAGRIYIVDMRNNRIQKFVYPATSASNGSWGRVKSMYR